MVNLKNIASKGAVIGGILMTSFSGLGVDEAQADSWASRPTNLGKISKTYPHCSVRMKENKNGNTIRESFRLSGNHPSCQGDCSDTGTFQEDVYNTVLNRRGKDGRPESIAKAAKSCAANTTRAQEAPETTTNNNTQPTGGCSPCSNTSSGNGSRPGLK